jgi:hypothetical protein
LPHSHLAEVFGFPTDNLSSEAERVREGRLCPFNNVSERCTKTSTKNPLGVCSVFSDAGPTITCPVRFTQDELVTKDAAQFFGFSPGSWESLTEVQLTNKAGQSAGKIDSVLAVRDSEGKVSDFGALEVQAVYISGTVRPPFEHYMEDRRDRQHHVWEGEDPPHADNLSSYKRLVMQIIFKGTILNAWGKKLAVATHKNFFAMFPDFPVVPVEQAEVAWLVYDLTLNTSTNSYNLEREKTIYTRFDPAIESLSTSEPGPLEAFEEDLRRKLDNKKKKKRRRKPAISPDQPAFDGV